MRQIKARSHVAAATERENSELVASRMMTMRRDPVVYSNPFDPLLMFNGILSDVISRDGHVSEIGNADNKNVNNSNNAGGDSCAQPPAYSPHAGRSTSTVGALELNLLKHYHNHAVRMRDSTDLTSSAGADNAHVESDHYGDHEALAELHETTSDDVARIARAVFSDRVRLLWSDPAASPLPRTPTPGVLHGAGPAESFSVGLWPNPGPLRRPLYVPWRMRHYLAYARLPPLVATSNGITLANMLVQFKEMRREEIALKSSRFTLTTSAVYAKLADSRQQLCDGVHRSSPSCSLARTNQFMTAGDTCGASAGHLLADCGAGGARGKVARSSTAASLKFIDTIKERTNVAETRTRKLCHSFSDSDLHKGGHQTDCPGRRGGGTTKLSWLPVKSTASTCTSRAGVTTLMGREQNLKDWTTATKNGPLFNTKGADGSMQSMRSCLSASVRGGVSSPVTRHSATSYPMSAPPPQGIRSSTTTKFKESGRKAAESPSPTVDLATSDVRQCKSAAAHARHGKPPLPPAKDRRRIPPSLAVMFPKKNTMSTSSDCCNQWKTSSVQPASLTSTGRGHHQYNHHQQQQQQQQQQQHQMKPQQEHHRKKNESSSVYSIDYPLTPASHAHIPGSNSVTIAGHLAPVTAYPPPTQVALRPGTCMATTTAPTTSVHAAAPLFTAVPTAAGVLLPVNARRCAANGVLQPAGVDPTTSNRHHHHQQMIVTEPPPASAQCARLYRASPVGPAGPTVAGWPGFTPTATAGMAQPQQPAMCHEYLLVGPSSVFLLR